MELGAKGRKVVRVKKVEERDASRELQKTAENLSQYLADQGMCIRQLHCLEREPPKRSTGNNWNGKSSKSWGYKDIGSMVGETYPQNKSGFIPVNKI